MQDSPSPDTPLFIPTAARAWQGGRLPGGMIMAGALAILIGWSLPWLMMADPSLHRTFSTVRDGEDTVILLMGLVAFIAGYTILISPTHTARLLAGLSSLVVVGAGAWYIRQVFQVAAMQRLHFRHAVPDPVFGPGFFIIGIGVVLIMAGVVLQRQAR